ncbi:TPA: hypothetical protein I7152_11105 [Vibrio vulnificus]|nr:hypothetical protein [Vibrio vulnificus]
MKNNKSSVNNFLIGILLIVPSLVDARPQFAQKQIQLSATIPVETVSGNLVSYILDGDFKRLDYNPDTRRFSDIWFYVRSESELSSIPGGYSFIQTYNNLSCYGGVTSDVTEMNVKINGKPIVSGRVDLDDVDLWYRGASKYYSDVAVEMSSPLINNNTEKWCIGRVTLIVSKSI